MITPTVYIQPFWIYRGIEIKNIQAPMLIRIVLQVKNGSSRESTIIRIMDEKSKNIEELPIADIEENWIGTGRRLGVTRIPY
jgi:hypothetical protein